MVKLVERLRKNFAKLVSDEQGTSVVELALVAPLLISMIVGVTDIARGFSAKLDLTQTAQSIVSKVMQSGFQAGELEELREQAAKAAAVETDQVEISFWQTCNGVRQATASDEASFYGTCGAGENNARFVRVRIAKSFEPMFGQLKMYGSRSDGSYLLHGEAGIRIQ